MTFRPPPAARRRDLVEKGLHELHLPPVLGSAQRRGLGIEDSEPTTSPCYSCDQQGADSRFIRRLNEGDDTPGPESFTQIATEDDEIIIPYTNCFLKGAERTRNLTLQKYYERYYQQAVIVTHQNIYDDPVAQKLMLDALDNPGPRGPTGPSKIFSCRRPVPARHRRPVDYIGHARESARLA